MADNNASKSGGIGIAGVLGILFIGLKLGHVITWSWLWVLAPFWIPFAIVIGVFVLALLFSALCQR